MILFEPIRGSDLGPPNDTCVILLIKMRMTDEKLSEWKDTHVNNGNKVRMSTDECAIREPYTLYIHI